MHLATKCKEFTTANYNLIIFTAAVEAFSIHWFWMVQFIWQLWSKQNLGSLLISCWIWLDVPWVFQNLFYRGLASMATSGTYHWPEFARCGLWAFMKLKLTGFLGDVLRRSISELDWSNMLSCTISIHTKIYLIYLTSPSSNHFSSGFWIILAHVFCFSQLHRVIRLKARTGQTRKDMYMCIEPKLRLQ